jgi:UDP-N-acetylglucosamine transferase subunit ALG13
MIFVTVGGQPAPFDRLLHAVASLATIDEVVVQYGTSRVRPPGARCIDFLSFDEFLEYMRASRVVVGHAGVGTTMVALFAGKRPIVVPRQASLGEDPDGHQGEFARRLDAAGLVQLVEDSAELGAAVLSAGDIKVPETGVSRRLVEDLREYFVDIGCGRSGQAAAATAR